jgi:hypothetical protein
MLVHLQVLWVGIVILFQPSTCLAMSLHEKSVKPQKSTGKSKKYMC